MAETFPQEIVTLTRDEVVAKYLRDYQFRVPDADVGPGTQPATDAAVMADQMMIIHADAVVIGANTNLDTSTGNAVDDALRVNGLTARLPATGATGYVTIEASVGGAFILAGSELKTTVTNKRYQSFVSALYQNGEQVLIGGIDTGPTTNQEAGTVRQWTSPPGGLSANCTVFEASDGTGLINGREAETDAEAIQRIIDAKANPPASGNEAEYIQQVEATPGLAIQKAFAIPASPDGPGNMSVAFMLRPASPGASRLPTGAQRALVAANLAAVMPGDDGIFDLEVIGDPLAVYLAVSWRETASGWTDVAPWPAYIPGDPVLIKAAPAPTALSARVVTATATTTPQVGQTIAIYNASLGLFAPKRIATVTVIVATKEWQLTFDASNAASDTTYVPIAGQAVSPFSDSMDALAEAVIAHVDTMGPGEVVATFPDPGQRQRREPRSPEEWPSSLTNRVITPVLEVGAVADADVLFPAVPFAVTVGTPGTLCYLFELDDLAAFPQ